MTQSYQQGNSMVWFDDEIITDPSQALFDAQYWQEQDKVVGSASGRGTTWFVQLDTMQAALRHYRRGGLFGKLVEDHYWFTGWEQTRSLQEFNLLRVLIESGVNVPRPIAARAVKTGLTYQADLLSERIPNAKDLVSILQEKSLSEMMYRKIGQEVAKMHNENVNHTDLNIHNILIDKNENVWIIDFDKCQVEHNSGWKSANISRLKRSFLKEQDKRQIKWQEIDFEVLLDGYQAALR
ncbi:3-deoxy-D-manno-octulosonic acid kinase [Vibrio vulnificus]|uniref:3-deoxy-D-manno-octulosonic acid kinase n=1 Tax=Vibrio vulnificus TaxID=672 RepID=UPI001B81BEB0|nr:3-deoxy-D-manno-octulosonic acid kinase [Vibrio vulnificus]MCJ0806713.1 3-deoxy-D-manno-octulosonic acid kinase [Vibrio vulnificus]MCU8408651.1 3-deoxy-D-manno-octulosonic acid kinase [Vibrio vulnificus]HBC3535316.1 3-deoxy-D-manno-octulosonic acid kinase [Vibrio vulnificus]HBH7893682.1 3-deoxy-D-manno-octulosonic acid kinase [Vibrio vulnificus]HDY7525547.1 3-deoxy-D-manno-octulosonic acid kinase [Vibrio vulnificus]